MRIRIREIANDRPRFGYTRIHAMLRREGWGANLKRVHRLYRLEGLQVRMWRRRKKRLSLCSLPRQVDGEGGEFSACCRYSLGGNFPSAPWGRSSL
jgi:putative transposase